MFHTAFPRGQGPAYPDLPPTLQPCVIAASAPPSDHLRTATLSGGIYLLLAGGVLALASVAPQTVLPGVQFTRPERVVEFEPPVLTPSIERAETRPGTSGGPVSTEAAPVLAVTNSVPDQFSATLSREDHSGDKPVQGLLDANATALKPGPGPSVPASGPRIHDFSMTGLTVRHQVAPIYPDMARHARIQGPVVLMMTVDERGQPIQVQVLEGHPVFHGPAMQAARQWRFEPALMDGRPVSAAFRLTLKFTLR